MTVVNITTVSDRDFYHSFTYKVQGGSGIDLRDVTMKMGVRKNAADVTELLSLTTENEAIVKIDALNGKFTLRITPQQLQRLPTGDYVHSLIGTLGGVAFAIWDGTMSHSAGPSR